MNRVLTKSIFKLGLECPNKLYYTKKENEFANQKQDNPFLQALASGGFQVEELAKLHYPEGVLVEDKKSDNTYAYAEKIATTNLLLEAENVVIFEAAFQFQNLFIRVDILEKKGNNINLIEVKSKSFEKGNPKKEVKYNSDWKFHLFDVAFQKYVVEKSFPSFKVTPYLMLADKNKTSTINGLNQLFRVTKKTDNRTGVTSRISKLNNVEEESVLSRVDISEIIYKIEIGEHRILEHYGFEDAIQLLSKAYQENRFFDYDLNFQACKRCEFKTTAEEFDLKSGFKNCFSKKLSWTELDFNEPTIFEISKLHHTKTKYFSDKLILKLVDTDDEEFCPKNESSKVLDGWSLYERQIIQKDKAINKDTEPKVLKEKLKKEIDSWTLPLNFIDFETSMVALPFYSGQKPNEKVVFQFSHHIYHEDGHIEHANQFINLKPGFFPNFQFVRELKKALAINDGTVFQFSPFENTTLNQIKIQLEESSEADKDELIKFIKSLTTPSKDTSYKGEIWTPDRGIVDLCEVIKAYYYNPLTRGSNSIKDVLPAVLKTSKFVINKFSKPIKDLNLTSKNFNDNKIWLTKENGKVVDPYKSLGKIHKDQDDTLTLIGELDEINNGGAALTAYGRCQYKDMSDMERKDIQNALLKYCELDTLAMVMIYEHLREITL